jgi:hypothetical protein
MFKALLRTTTKICDNEKAAYSFLNMIGACVLHICYKVEVQDALLLVSPLTFLTLAQAYVDAVASRQPRPALLPVPSMPVPEPVGPAIPSIPAA